MPERGSREVFQQRLDSLIGEVRAEEQSTIRQHIKDYYAGRISPETVSSWHKRLDEVARTGQKGSPVDKILVQLLEFNQHLF